MAIEVSEIGETPYGGKIYWLEAEKPFMIPALRGVISWGELKGEKITILGAAERLNENPKMAQRFVDRILEQRHLSLGEISKQGIYLSGVTRLNNFIGWIPVGASRGVQGVGTERSLRRAKPGDFVDAKDDRLRELNQTAFNTYSELLKEAVGKEDARFGLTLSTATEEIIQIPQGREQAKWANYMGNQPFEEPRSIGKALEEQNSKLSGIRTDVFDGASNFMPLSEEDEPSSINEIFDITKKELPEADYCPDHQSLVIRDRGSISSYHQDVRNRQVNFSWPSWERVVHSDRYVFPPKLTRSQKDKLNKIYERAQEIGEGFWERGEYEKAVFSQPLGKELRVIGRILGNRNIQYTVMYRACEQAQWEIRGRYKNVKKEIQSEFPLLLGPRCQVEGKCYEARGPECPYYNTYVKT